MKKILLTLLAAMVAFSSMAQHATTREEMMKEWRQMKQKRDISQQAKQSSIPLGEAAPAPKNAKALPEDRVWFPGEWEEVKAIVVTPYYSYYPDTNLGSGYFSADPMVTGVAEYFKYNMANGWQSLNLFGPYRSEMDTTSSFGLVFFRLMDGIQRGNAEAWVRVEKAEDSAKVLRTLVRKNFRHDNVRFIVGPGNSFWYRDCGPICFYYGDQDSVAMMDFEYYPGRALDDSLPSLIYRQMNIPNYINTIEWEGGNCLVDGAGFLLPSDAIYENNNDSYGQLTWNGRDISTINYSSKPRLTQTQTRRILGSLLGQRETHILPAYRYDGGTGHIDLYADMCEENGFVFSVMPNDYRNWTDFRTGSRNIDSLCSYTSLFDRPYYQTSIPVPSKVNGANFTNHNEYNYLYTRTYSNHTFVNDLILQPCFSAVVNGEPSAIWDRNNIEQLKAAYPGYTIYPVDVRDFDGSGGAIHCVTKQIPADNPVRILHKSIVGCANALQDEVPVSAIITNRSGIEHAECIYRINGGEWETVNLTANGNRHYGHMPRPQSTFYKDSIVTDTTFTIFDSIAVIDSTLSSDSITYIVDTSYTYLYDTTTSEYTMSVLVDTVITFEYYISATSNNGKTITKPMTALQGGYYSFYFTGQTDTVVWLDSTLYDFDTTPMPATNITFLFDADNTTLDTSTAPELPVLGISEASGEKAFGQFYPNPSSDQAHINIDLGNGGNYEVSIIDNLGRVIHTSTLQTAGNIRYTIRTSSLPAGLYTVRFAGKGINVTRRLIVQQ